MELASGWTEPRQASGWECHSCSQRGCGGMRWDVLQFLEAGAGGEGPGEARPRNQQYIAPSSLRLDAESGRGFAE